MDWFTADWHCWHKNIMKLTKRPFENMDEMINVLIERWNASVGVNDRGFFLGDFAFCNKNMKQRQVEQILSVMNGQKFLIKGNHDGKYVYNASGWADVYDLKRIKSFGQKIVLCHYAMLTWQGSHKGSWHLHGHSHGSLMSMHDAKCLDVGVDCWNYYPVNFDTIKSIIDLIGFEPVDHHGEEVPL